MSENFNTECNETILDNDSFDENMEQKTVPQLDELTKHIGNMFNNPDMQNALKGMFESLKPKSSMSLTQEELTKYEMSHEDITLDINTRILPHLLSKLSGNCIKEINIEKESKVYSTLNLVYGATNYLVSTGNDKNEVELYRDRMVSQLIWVNLFDANNYYDKPTEETNKLISETMKSFSAGIVSNKLSNLNMNDLFKQINSSV